MKNSISITSLGLLLILSPAFIYAQSVTSYKITGSFQQEHSGPIGVGRVFFSKSLGVNYQQGKIILSSTPDATGSAQLQDTVQIINGSNAYTFDAYPLGCIGSYKYPVPTDVTQFFNSGNNSITVRLLDWCGRTKNISEIYLVHFDSPVPFLELPWDYENKGLSFSEAALSMSSYFDHSYPLLSSGLTEPASESGQITTFKNGESSKLSYSGHDGYDYAFAAKALFGNAVYAAASGSANYINSCTPCGNMIIVDHHNGYQTRYLHLQKEGLITSTPGQKIEVGPRQQIGKIGATGNVIPAGHRGAHIHFGLFEDKNRDLDFEDNIPDGATDPFGWHSLVPDPWQFYSFWQNNKLKQGNKNHYLWKKKLNKLSSNLNISGGRFAVANIELNFPQGAATANSLRINIEATPVELDSTNLKKIGVGYKVEVRDTRDNIVDKFLRFIGLVLNFSAADISNIDLNSISVYSSQDGVTWKKETTTLNQGKAAIQTDHLSYFVLAGEKIDTTASSTQITLLGSQLSNIPLTLKPGVLLSFDVSDDTDYVLYKNNQNDWESYTSVVKLDSEGSYSIQYYSADKAGNIEDIRLSEFYISNNTISPTSSANISPTSLAVIPTTPLKIISATPSATQTPSPITKIPTAQINSEPKKDVLGEKTKKIELAGTQPGKNRFSSTTMFITLSIIVAVIIADMMRRRGF